MNVAILAYPVDLVPDSNGTVLVTFPDFPEGATFGEDESDALLRAVEVLETVLAARIDDREEIPPPSAAANRPCVVLPALSAAKVLLYRERQCDAAGGGWGHDPPGRQVPRGEQSEGGQREGEVLGIEDRVREQVDAILPRMDYGIGCLPGPSASATRRERGRSS